MGTTDLSVGLMNALEQENCRGKFLSVDHLEDLESDINSSYQQGAVEKLEGLDLIGYANVLGRNLDVLIRKHF